MLSETGKGSTTLIRIRKDYQAWVENAAVVAVKGYFWTSGSSLKRVPELPLLQKCDHRAADGAERVVCSMLRNFMVLDVSVGTFISPLYLQVDCPSLYWNEAELCQMDGNKCLPGVLASLSLCFSSLTFDRTAGLQGTNQRALAAGVS